MKTSLHLTFMFYTNFGMKMFGSRVKLIVLDQIQLDLVTGESEGGQTVSNPHVNPYIDEKCMLLCENQALGYGNICSTCPDMKYEENILLNYTRKLHQHSELCL